MSVQRLSQCSTGVRELGKLPTDDVAAKVVQIKVVAVVAVQMGKYTSLLTATSVRTQMDSGIKLQDQPPVSDSKPGERPTSIS